MRGLPALKWLGVLLAVLVWAGFMFWQLDEFAFPSMDSWCYFAPAAFGSHPFDLSMPLLANFEGADHSWALNWPGYLLLLSFVLPFLPKTTAVFVGVMMAQWLALAVATWAWARVVLGHRSWVTAGVFFLTLLDVDCFGVAWLHRQEIISGLVVLGAVASVHRLNQEQGRWGAGLVLGGCFFLLPLMQPTVLCWGAAFLGFGAGLALWNRRWPPYLLPAGIAFGAGLLVFYEFYTRQSGGWALLREAARTNADLTYKQGHYFIGRTLLWSLLQPKMAGSSCLRIAALVVSLALLPALARKWWRRQEQLEASPLALTVFVFLGLLLLTQLTYNAVYMSLCMPAAAVLFGVVLQKAELRWGGRVAGGMLALVLVLQAGYYAGKTYVIAQAGFPDVRGGLVRLRESLPAAHLILIPESMWEATLEKPGALALNSVPCNCAPERQQRYETMIYGRLQPGDLVLIDRIQSHPPLIPIAEPEWERVGEQKAIYHSDRDSGFDITIWRKR